MTTKHTLECDRAAVKKTHNGVRCPPPSAAPASLPHLNRSESSPIMHIDEIHCSLGFTSLFIVVR